MLRALVAAALLAAPARAADAPLLEIVSRRTIEPSAFIPVAESGMTSVPLALVVESGSGWDAPGVLEKMLGKASWIFGQCGVSLGTAQVVTVRWNAEGLRRLNDENPFHGPSKKNVMSEPLLPMQRPLGLLFGKSIPSVAEAYNKLAVDGFKAAYPDAVLLLDTFWTTYDQETGPITRDVAPTFSMAAHELTHILGNLSHISAYPNLMTTDDTHRGAKSGDLLPEQCAEIRRLY